MPRIRLQPTGTIWTALVAAVLALSIPWLARWRLPSPDRYAGHVFRVTSGADSGPGSLREAIFAADRADGRARIAIGVSRIVVETSLPPLLNPAGVIVDGQSAAAVVDARALAGGPVLDLAAPNCVVTGLRIEGARGEAIMVRQSGAHLNGVTIADSGVAVFQAGADGVVIEGSTFDRNTVGIQIGGASSPATLRNNRFQDHRRAAIWAVRSDTGPLENLGALEVLRNTFSGDRQSIVVLNIPVRIQRNTFADAHDAAVYASGSRIVVSANRIRSGRGFGVYLERVDRSVVSDNELDHNCSGGLMIRSAHHTQITFNRVYSNGYGIILVHGSEVGTNTVADNLIAQHVEDGMYVIGSSPIVRRNRFFQNRKDGMHLSSLVAGRDVIASEPLLDGNILAGNGNDDVRRDRYVPPVREADIAQAGDCGWRLPAGSTQVSLVEGVR